MTQFLPNDWNAIAAFYREAEPDILAAGANEWGIAAYLWDNGMLHMTPIEEWLWHDIRMNNAVLYPQYPVSRFFVDFGNPAAKVAIECDGAAYHQDVEKDDLRDEDLRALGWTVYRAPGWLCKTDSDPETGEPGQAYAFVRDICERHGISRFSQSPKPGNEWERYGDFLPQVVRRLQREAAIRHAAVRAARFPRRLGY